MERHSVRTVQLMSAALLIATGSAIGPLATAQDRVEGARLPGPRRVATGDRPDAPSAHVSVEMRILLMSQDLQQGMDPDLKAAIAPALAEGEWVTLDHVQFDKLIRVVKSDTGSASIPALRATGAGRKMPIMFLDPKTRVNRTGQRDAQPRDDITADVVAIPTHDHRGIVLSIHAQIAQQVELNRLGPARLIDQADGPRDVFGAIQIADEGIVLIPGPILALVGADGEVADAARVRMLIVARPTVLPSGRPVERVLPRWRGVRVGGFRAANEPDEVPEGLDVKIPIRFEDNTLESVIEYLSTSTQVNMFVNWAALEPLGITPDTRVTLKTFQPITASVALARVLEYLNGDVGSDDAAAYTVEDGSLLITTQSRLAKRTGSPRLYDVRRLLIDPANPDESSMQRIVDLVRQTVDPEAWDVTSFISSHNGTLVVRTTAGNHREIEGLINQLGMLTPVQVVCETRFLLVDEAAAEALVRDLQLMPSDAVWVRDPVRRLGSKVQRLASFVGDDEAADLVALLRKDANATVLSAPTSTLRSGVAGEITVVDEVPYVADYDRDEQDGKWMPKVEYVREGVSLSTAGTITADRRYVHLIVHPQWTRVLDMQEQPFDADAPDRELSVQVPRTSTWETIVNAIVPDKATLVLFGGGRTTVRTGADVEPAPGPASQPGEGGIDNDGAAADGRTMLMLIKPTIILQRPRGERLFPGLLDEPAAREGPGVRSGGAPRATPTRRAG